MGTTQSTNTVAVSAILAVGATGAALHWALKDKTPSQAAPWRTKHTLVKHEGSRLGMVRSLRKDCICGASVLATLRALASVSNRIPSLPTKRPFSWIVTPSQMNRVLSTVWAELQRPGCGILAVDSEHHSTFSYNGYLCLVQLSTLSQDVVIDVCNTEIRDALKEPGSLLRQILTSTDVVKVLHGCANDSVWLATNFGICIHAPVFDTHEAAKCASMSAQSFASLVKSLLVADESGKRIILDKSFQLSDWRVRPLAEKQLAYARDDTRLLLPVAAEILRRLNRSWKPAPSGTTAPAAAGAAKRPKHDQLIAALIRSVSIAVPTPPGTTRVKVSARLRAAEVDSCIETLRAGAAASLGSPLNAVAERRKAPGKKTWQMLVTGWWRSGRAASAMRGAGDSDADGARRAVIALCRLWRWRDCVGRDADVHPAALVPSSCLASIAVGIARSGGSESEGKSLVAAELARCRDAGGRHDLARADELGGIFADEATESGVARILQGGLMGVVRSMLDASVSPGLVAAAFGLEMEALGVSGDETLTVMQGAPASTSSAEATAKEAGIRVGMLFSSKPLDMADQDEAKVERGAKLMTARKTLLYDNIEMWNARPHDELLAKISLRKCLWYADRQLGYFQLTAPELAVLKEYATAGAKAAAVVATELGVACAVDQSLTDAAREAETAKNVSLFVETPSISKRVPPPPVPDPITGAEPMADGNGLPDGIDEKEFASGKVYIDIHAAQTRLAAVTPSAVSKPGARSLRASKPPTATATAPPKPRAVRLRLCKEARGRGMQGDPFHLEDKSNQCVLCGKRTGLTRLYVVPKHFRLHLPKACKSHNSHDVVLTCAKCHVLGDRVAAKQGRWWAEHMHIVSSRSHAKTLIAKPSVQKKLASMREEEEAAAAAGDVPLAELVEAWDGMTKSRTFGCVLSNEAMATMLRGVMPADRDYEKEGERIASIAARKLEALHGTAHAAAASRSSASPSPDIMQQAALSRDHLHHEEEGDDDDHDDDEDDDETPLSLDTQPLAYQIREAAMDLICGCVRTCLNVAHTQHTASETHTSGERARLVGAIEGVARLYAATRYEQPSAADADTEESIIAGVSVKAYHRLKRCGIVVVRELLLEMADSDPDSLSGLCALAPSSKHPSHSGPCVDVEAIQQWLEAQGVEQARDSSPAAVPLSAADEASVRVSVGAYVSRQIASGMHAARIVRLLLEGAEAAQGLEKISPWMEDEAEASARAAADESALGKSGLTLGAERRLESFIRAFRRGFQTDLRPRFLQKNWSVDYPAILDRTEHRNL